MMDTMRGDLPSGTVTFLLSGAELDEAVAFALAEID
jgi:hypothetical protein